MSQQTINFLLPGSLISLARGTGRLIFILKETNQIVNANTTLQNDTQLFFPIEPDESWIWVAQLYVISGSTPDFKYTYIAPAGATGRFSTPRSFSLSAALGATIVLGGIGATPANETIFGNITNGSTRGNVTFQWAQNVSDASDTECTGDSWLAAFKL